MNQYVCLLVSISIVDFVAAMMPGPNFVLVMQMGMSRGRGKAIAATAGITMGNLAWSLAVAFGLVALFGLVPRLYGMMKLAGGAYLIYMGLRLWFPRTAAGSTSEPSFQSTSAEAFTRGLLTTLLNPKCAVYFGSIFTWFMAPGTPRWVQAAIVGIVCFNSVLWYGIVAVLFSSSAARRIHNVLQRPIERVAGTAMAALGFRLAFGHD